MTKTIDPTVYDLARAFLEDHEKFNELGPIQQEHVVRRLAVNIQDVIEDEIRELNEEAQRE